jgi:hypothetical protein
MKVTVPETMAEGFIGFFNHLRRRPGDVFVIPDSPRRLPFPGEQKMIEGNDEVRAVFDAVKDSQGKIPSQFSFRWMRPVDAGTPEKTSTSQEALDKKSAQIKQEKAAAKSSDQAGDSKDVL